MSGSKINLPGDHVDVSLEESVRHRHLNPFSASPPTFANRPPLQANCPDLSPRQADPARRGKSVAQQHTDRHPCSFRPGTWAPERAVAQSLSQSRDPILKAAPAQVGHAFGRPEGKVERAGNASLAGLRSGRTVISASRRRRVMRGYCGCWRRISRFTERPPR